ncbi:MAG: LlaJI family restriction endonuclease [Clostridia bacterium]|nr:LlaJI family restriction endonuclease [Clostridia bacterium]
MTFIYGKDGGEIHYDIELKNSDKRYDKKNEKEVYDFVGFIIQKDKILTVFPKYFFNDKKELKKEDVTLLFNVISKYASEHRKDNEAYKYIGYKKNFESDYPFEDFYSIYDYYKKYGVYKDEEKVIKPNSNGKISWKDTIRRSNVLISNNNMMFLPIYTKKNSFKKDFIGECMTYVINYTIRNFSYFINLNPIHVSGYKLDFIANKDYTIKQLRQCKNSVFKDHQKKLVNSLIDFFEKFDEKSSGGNIHFKINYFKYVWEKMVEKYLNDYFVEVDKKNKKLVFSENKINKNLFSKETFCIGKSTYEDVDNNKLRYLEPDHYGKEKKIIYVFDSKYYQYQEKDLTTNYKQIAYTFLLGNKQNSGEEEIYSALIFPGEERYALHIELNDDFAQMKPGCNFIIEQYLDVRKVMENYLDILN